MLEGEKPSKEFYLKYNMSDKFTKMIEWARFIHFEGKIDDLKKCEKILETTKNNKLEFKGFHIEPTDIKYEQTLLENIKNLCLSQLS